MYFLLLVSEEKYSDYFEQINKELKNPLFPLDKKIKEWPILIFGKGLELGKGAG